MNIICQSLYYQYILDKFHLLKSPKTFRVIITIILCCPCYMPKYVSRLEGIMQTRRECFGSALCLLTLGRISAYNMDNTILLYKYSLQILLSYQDILVYTVKPVFRDHILDKEKKYKCRFVFLRCRFV